MKLSKFIVLFLLLALFCSAYAGSKRVEGTVADTTHECVFMREVCEYAWELQREVDAMTEGDEDERAQKREMLQVLNSSIMRCENARRECTNREKKKK
jgi:hypothetical protein